MTRAEIEALIATDAAFRAWLASRPARSRVGERCDCTACPIAEWLFAEGCSSPIVGDERITTGLDEIATPEWARNFIHAVDAGTGQRATARTCLRLLDQVSPAPSGA